MTDTSGSLGDAPGNIPGPTSAAGDSPDDRFAAIMRFPRKTVLISGALVPVTVALNLFALEHKSGPLFGVSVVSTVVCILALWNVTNFSPTAIARLEALAPQVGGRFTLWKAGAGGYAGTPFTYSTEHERFGMLNFVADGMPVEIGHLSSQLSAQHRAPTARRHAYVVVRLPDRLPHMIVSFGHLSRVLGIRVAPEQWHRSQRVDVGGGRRFRLYVADGGEQVARSFFNPDLVKLFQRIGRFYDVEINGRNLYLFSGRSVAAGSDRRWQAQRALIDDLAAQVAVSSVWELVRRRHRGRGGALRADVARAVKIVVAVIIVAIVVISLISLKLAGLIG